MLVSLFRLCCAGRAMLGQSDIHTLIYFPLLVSACSCMKPSCISHHSSKLQLTCARSFTLRQMMLRFMLQWFIVGLLAEGPLLEWHTGEISLHRAKASLHRRQTHPQTCRETVMKLLAQLRIRPLGRCRSRCRQRRSNLMMDQLGQRNKGFFGIHSTHSKQIMVTGLTVFTVSSSRCFNGGQTRGRWSTTSFMVHGHICHGGGIMCADNCLRLGSGAWMHPDHCLRLHCSGTIHPDHAICLGSGGRMHPDHGLRLQSRGMMHPDHVLRLQSQQSLRMQSPKSRPLVGKDMDPLGGMRAMPVATGGDPALVQAQVILMYSIFCSYFS